MYRPNKLFLLSISGNKQPIKKKQKQRIIGNMLAFDITILGIAILDIISDIRVLFIKSRNIDNDSMFCIFENNSLILVSTIITVDTPVII